MQDFLVGLTKEDVGRIRLTLEKLYTHFNVEDLILAGGVSIRHHIISKGLNFPLRNTDNIDVLITKKDALKPAVNKDFLIFHYHIGKPGDRDRFFFELVDPNTKIKVHIFDETIFPSFPVVVSFLDKAIKIRSAEDQMVVRVIEMVEDIHINRVNAKWLKDAKLLITVLDMGRAEAYWKQVATSEYCQSYTELRGTTTLEQVWSEVLKFAELHPESVSTDNGENKVTYICKGCVVDPNFPLTPLDKIYKLLGYTADLKLSKLT